MKILYRYVLGEHVGPFVFAIFTATLVLLLARIFKMMELIISKGVDVLTVGELFSYFLPSLLAMTVPMGVMVASLMAFGRLSADNEITALRGAGVSLYRLIWPVLVAGLVIAAGMYLFIDRVVPESNLRFKDLMLSIGMKRPDLELKERVFIQDFPGYELYIEEMDDRTGEMHNVTIFQMEGGRLKSTIVADRGKVASRNVRGVVVLELYDGEMHEVSPDNPDTYRRLRFDRQTVNLEFDSELVRTAHAAKGDREMTTAEMRDAVAKLDEGIAMTAAEPAATYIEEKYQFQQIEMLTRRKNEYLVEVYKKTAIPFACAALILVGAPLGVVVRGAGKGAGFSFSIGFFLVYYIMLLAGEAFGDRDMIPPFLAMWLPNILLTALGVWLLIRAAHGMVTLPALRFLDVRRWPLVRTILRKRKPRWAREEEARMAEESRR
ncbi:MAG: LptF/LptG family permease [Candidatus Coatesbacteria bacterium]|nr:MAG: LptF/LptG family permease [Candidatus Coatesbacteria bacterium]